MKLFDPRINDIYINPEVSKRIKSEWLNFLKGRRINKDILPEEIVESWKHCKLLGVNANDTNVNSIVNTEIYHEDIESQRLIDYNKILFNCIQKITEQLIKLDLHVHHSIRFSDGKLITLSSDDISFVYDASEETLGTTSMSLASNSGKTVFLHGGMHYKKIYHNMFCISKPINYGQSIVGILTISGNDIAKLREAYAFLLSMEMILTREYANRTKPIAIEALKIKKPLGASYTFDNIIGNNKEMIKLKKLALKISENDLPVLICGETGTGKEVLAQAIHNAGKRSSKPFVAINCGALAKGLAESELFGYEPGAFTGALKNGKKGKLEAASGGTLFLDEIDSMPLDLQVKLLRAISCKTITKIGGTTPIPIDIRIISATKVDLLKKADEGTFREDLYYRISNFNPRIPPLRERIDDIPLLVTWFVEEYVRKTKHSPIKIKDEFIEHLSYYYWRGNIRELENIVHTSIALIGQEKELTSDLLPDKIIKAYNYNKNKRLFNLNSDKTIDTLSLKDQLGIYEELIIEKILKEYGNISLSARALGISKKSLYRKLENHPRLKR